MDDPIRTLFHPFETGLVDRPGANARGLFFNARAGLRLPAGVFSGIEIVQGFRPDYLWLDAAGFSVTPRPMRADHDFALVLAGRHRGLNEARIADAAARVKPGGLVVVAGGKNDGAASLRKRVVARLPVAGHVAKHRGVAFWFAAPADQAALAPENEGRPLVEDRYRTAPGMFSPDHADPGSRLLIDVLPADLGGDVADFGAGWGYLSCRLAEAFEGVQNIDLYEADFESLEAARDNLARIAPDRAAGFFWRDLLAEPVARRYDVVVMNPPFHRGRAAEPDIGAGMIRAAHGALAPRGRLFLVANRNLPYEAPLKARFGGFEMLREQDGYKVLVAFR